MKRSIEYQLYDFNYTGNLEIDFILFFLKQSVEKETGAEKVKRYGRKTNRPKGMVRIKKGVSSIFGSIALVRRNRGVRMVDAVGAECNGTPRPLHTNKFRSLASVRRPVTAQQPLGVFGTNGPYTTLAMCIWFDFFFLHTLGLHVYTYCIYYR